MSSSASNDPEKALGPLDPVASREKSRPRVTFAQDVDDITPSPPPLQHPTSGDMEKIGLNLVKTHSSLLEIREPELPEPESIGPFRALKRLYDWLGPEGNAAEQPSRGHPSFYKSLRGPIHPPIKRAAQKVLGGLIDMLEFLRDAPIALVAMLRAEVGIESDDRSTETGTTELVVDIEFLHRYNVLWARTKLLQHYYETKDLVDNAVAEQINKDLHEYSNALRDYLFLRNEGQFLFPTSKDLMNPLAKETASRADMLSRLKTLDPDSEEARTVSQDVDAAGEKIGRVLLETMAGAISGITERKRRKDTQNLWARLSMALGGGLALIAPMLIMALIPTKTVALVTTSCFVVFAAISLAIFMRDSQPKDVVACTAAYAAVLVVFVGVGGGA